MVTTERTNATGRRRLRRARDRAARRYDRAAALPDEVGRRMLERLEMVRLPEGPILDAGCATGATTRLLAQRFPRVPLLGMDAAPAMVREARAALPAIRRVLSGLAGTAPRWLAGDIDSLPVASRRFALAWSNLVLHWLPDPAAAFAEMLRTLVPGGLLMFSTLGPDTLKELRSAFAQADGRAHVHGFPDMHDLGDQLVHAGFAGPVMDMETITLTYPSADAMLHELRDLGSINALPERARSLTGRARWRRMVEALETHRRDGRIPATFEIVYGHAWKPEQGPTRTDDGRQVIRIHRGGRRM
jgi:malonyl-CoA O-methyltransferase